MPSLLLPSRVTQQPQQAGPVDAGNPLAAGLVSLVLPVAYPGFDLVANKLMTAVNAPGVAAGRGGMGLVFNGTSNYSWRSAPELGNAGKYTLVAVVQSNGNGTDTRLLGLGGSSGTAPMVSIGAGTSNAQKVRIYSRNDSAAPPVDLQSVSNPFDGALHTIVMTFDLASTTGRIGLWVDGVVDTIATGSESTSVTSVNQIALGTLLRTTAAGWWKGTIFMAAVYNRMLTDAEALQLSANAYQLIKAPVRRLWAPLASGGAINVSLDTGALSLTGYAPMVAQSVNQSVTPAAGTLSLTGYAPVVTQSATTSVLPQAGTLALTGFAPSVAQSANRSVTPAAGSMTLTGYAPTVTRTTNQQVQPAAGGLTLTGFAPLIFQGVDNAPRVNVATIMRITTTNRAASLGAVLNATASIRSTGPHVATIMSAGAVNRAADLGPATINRTVSFP